MFAKKSLGQNFLKDQKVLTRIAEVLDIQKDDIVVEIGPGHGELTKKLLAFDPKKIIAIEKDFDLVEGPLQDLIDQNSNLHILPSDALKEIPKIDYPYKLVGNIPYYITGHLMRILQQLENKPSKIVLTVQKEVANRASAAPPEMNMLAASLQFWAEVKLIRYISKKSFKPAPKVDSAIITITPLGPQPTQKEADSYYSLARVLFKQPRKTVLNNLKPLGASKDGLLEAGFDPSLRPQNLEIDDIRRLALLFTHN